MTAEGGILGVSVTQSSFCRSLLLSIETRNEIIEMPNCQKGIRSFSCSQIQFMCSRLYLLALSQACFG